MSYLLVSLWKLNLITYSTCLTYRMYSTMSYLFFSSLFYSFDFVITLIICLGHENLYGDSKWEFSVWSISSEKCIIPHFRFTKNSYLKKMWTSVQAAHPFLIFKDKIFIYRIQTHYIQMEFSFWSSLVNEMPECIHGLL